MNISDLSDFAISKGMKSNIFYKKNPKNYEEAKVIYLDANRLDFLNDMQ